jgi:hypothetical protein
MQIIVKVGIDHNLSHLGKKPPKGSEKGGDIRFLDLGLWILDF